LFAQDESYFCSESNRVTSWSKKGTKVVYSGYKYGTSVNCFGSLNLKTGELITTFPDKGNSETMIEHLKEVRKLYDKKIPLMFILDNATWHKSQVVKDFCQKNNITFIFIPPYSPEFNPIERIWSYLKSKVRQVFFPTAQGFRDFIFQLFKEVNLLYSEELSNFCCSLIFD